MEKLLPREHLYCCGPGVSKLQPSGQILPETYFVWPVSYDRSLMFEAS